MFRRPASSRNDQATVCSKYNDLGNKSRAVGRSEKPGGVRKGQKISKAIYGILNFPKKRTKKLDLTVSSGILFVHFLVELKTP